MEEPNIPQVIRFFFSEAKRFEAESARLTSEASRLANEARTFRKLADEMSAKFPDAKNIEETKGPLLTNMPRISFDDLQKHLESKQGRVKHVAARLGVSEDWIRDLINAPKSKFFIGSRGWIYRRPTGL
jgi:hypothetical protein